MQTEEIMRDTMIKDWFATISAKEGTRERYSEAMHHFTDLTKKTPTQLIEEAENEIREGKVMRMQQVRRYLIDFKEYLPQEVFTVLLRLLVGGGLFGC